MMRALAVMALLPLMAASTDPLEGRIAGKPQACIHTLSDIAPDIIDSHTILYRDGATIYRTTINSCPSLRRVSTLIVERYGSGLCRRDRFRVVDLPSTIPSGYCFFGDFVPYTKVKGRTG